VRRAVLALCVVALLGACSTPGKRPPPPREAAADDGKVFVYRVIRKWHGLSGRNADIYINEVSVMRFGLAPDYHTVLSLPAGRYELKQRFAWDVDLRQQTIALPFELAPRQKRYFRMASWTTYASAPLRESTEWEVREVSESEALPELRRSRYEAAIAFTDSQ
jgi:hypothetical protein